MNNIWKGLVVGAVTGAAIGLSVDLLRRAGEGVASAGKLAREHGPELTAAVSAAAKAGVERVREADLPTKVRDAARTAADSDTADTLRQVAKDAAIAVTTATKQAAAGVGDTIGHAADEASDRIRK